MIHSPSSSVRLLVVRIPALLACALPVSESFGKERAPSQRVPEEVSEGITYRGSRDHRRGRFQKPAPGGNANSDHLQAWRDLVGSQDLVRFL